MNPKFPNFNFDTWLGWFVQTLYMVDSRNKDFMEHEYPIEEKKEKFFNQEHDCLDEFREDFCENYLEDITRFNCFMKYIMQEDRTLKELIIFLLKMAFPRTHSHERITAAILIGKSYNINYDNIRNGVLFTPVIATYVLHLTQVLHIPLKDDN
jgi:hypothetical protein